MSFSDALAVLDAMAFADALSFTDALPVVDALAFTTASVIDGVVFQRSAMCCPFPQALKSPLWHDRPHLHIEALLTSLAR